MTKAVQVYPLDCHLILKCYPLTKQLLIGSVTLWSSKSANFLHNTEEIDKELENYSLHDTNQQCATKQNTSLLLWNKATEKLSKVFKLRITQRRTGPG